MTKTLQNWICWGVFGVLMATLVVAGGNAPTAWSLMAMAVLFAFTVQMALSFWRPRPAGLDGLWVPGVLFLLVLVWGTVQRLPWLPEGWAHPAWASAEAALAATGAGEGIRLSPVISADPGQGGHIVMRLTAYAMVFWIALRSALNVRRARAMLRAFAFASGLFALYGIIAWAVGFNPLLGIPERTALSSTFFNRNSYATFAGFGVLANLAMFFLVSRAAEARRHNPLVGFLEGLVSGSWLWLFGLILCIGALVLTQSRGGALAGVAGLMVFLIAYQWRSGARSRTAVIVAALLLVLAAVGAAAGLMDRIFNITDPHGRIAIYPRVLDAIGDRPLLGHGLGSFYDVFRAYVPQMSSFEEWDLAHSSYLENIFEMGVPAAALFYLALAMVGFRLIRGLVHRHRDRTILAFALGCFVVGAVHSIYDFSLQMPGLAAVFAWILGLGYAQSLTETDLSGPSTPFAQPRRRRKKRRKLLRDNVTHD